MSCFIVGFGGFFVAAVFVMLLVLAFKGMEAQNK
jgi:hypothetical protein